MTVTVTVTVERCGGFATWRELRRQHSRRAIERALANSEVLRTRRNLYTTPRSSQQLLAAKASAGALSHLSAALHHGWKVKTVPDTAWVTVPRKWGARPVPRDIHLHRSDIPSGQVEDCVTTPLRTLLDCARALPFDEALTVADSALRSGTVTRGELLAAATAARGPGSVRVRRVAEHASAKAHNPLESVLRALTIEVGLTLTPQLEVSDSGLYAKVDLGSEELRLIIEAEGYETHGTRKGLRRDCCRHTEFAVFGWTSLRYAYEDVMFEQGWVRWSLLAWVALQSDLPQPKRPRHVLPRAA
ncbi:hypothetical protein N802_11285 [Knoellia sinensis KCTC 19936]|uniref:DUF559 domain-containing protein n=1 Tax=Knoellia sinensis KCTC 19936 TaxID=1385520 RepID=A0A0A0J9A5_9MICO|nr:hypothetical protein [Knoellia sinensis]KGN32196.1 hypothetical protein N802_11285 [Knoellia sinensis KCTC 19936]